MLATLGGHTGAGIDGIRDWVTTRPAPESLPFVARPLLARRRHPGCDLDTRVEAQLVQDAAHVAVDGVLGDEQAGPNLLVAGLNI